MIIFQCNFKALLILLDISCMWIHRNFSKHLKMRALRSIEQSADNLIKLAKFIQTFDIYTMHKFPGKFLSQCILVRARKYPFWWGNKSISPFQFLLSMRVLNLNLLYFLSSKIAWKVNIGIFIVQSSESCISLKYLLLIKWQLWSYYGVISALQSRSVW